MYYLKTSAAFDSAHFLSGYEGKCANIHGHHWIIEAVISGEALQESGVQRGMLIDFGDIKREVRALADSFDHALIYEENTLKKATIDALCAENFHLIPIPFRPTAENFAMHFFTILKAKDFPVKNVTVYETPENCATYEVNE